MNFARTKLCHVKFCLWAVFFIPLTVPAMPPQGFTMQNGDAGQIILEWSKPAMSREEIAVNGGQFVRISLDGLGLYGQPGFPDLPADVYSGKIPDNQIPLVTILDTLFTEESLSRPLAPAPQFDEVNDDQALAIYRMDPAVYETGSWYPSMILEQATAIMRSERRFKITLWPVRYQPLLGRIRVLQYARLRITFAPMQQRTQTTTRTDTLQWLDASQSYVKLKLVSTGPYGVTGADLQELAITPAGIDPRTFKILYCGGSVPCVVQGAEDGRLDAGDRILFFAKRRDGGSEYYNAYSDTNAYWLSWGSGEGLRFGEPLASPPAESRDRFPDTLHIEKDLTYYAGDTDNEIHSTFTVAGEGWVWAVINRGTNFAFNFDLPGLAAEDDSVRIRIRLRGTTYDAATPDHHVQVYINNSLCQEAYFNDREEKILICSVARARVMEKNNWLEIRSLADTPAERSQFYLDWMDADYSRLCRAVDGQLMFTVPPEGADMFIDGFADDSIQVWDVSAGRSCVVEPAGHSWRSHFSVTSAGYLDGETALFYRDGLYVATGYRGHNLLRLDPLTGGQIEIKNFDTYGATAQADSMAAYIDRLPEGAVVLVAIRDEGSVAMTGAAHRALESLGSALTRSVGVRDSWVLYGRKGAAPGTVPELLKKSGQGRAVLAQVLQFSEGGSSFSGLVRSAASGGHRLAAFSSASIRRPLRLQRHQPDNLFDGGSGADYLIVTHRSFIEAAQQLATSHARRFGWRTRVVEAEAIEDDFNFGLAAPEAIRSFLNQAYRHWPPPAPQFVLFFGDASWDPKNLTSNATERNFVFSYGNPVSDSWFVLLDGEGDMMPDLYTGRLPVSSPEEARTMVEKIAAYENTPSAAWKKDFLFITGGFDFIEQSQFSQQSQHLINDFVAGPPVYGRATLLQKTSQGLNEGEHRQDILDAIDEGRLWVNFIGHAGSRTWDLMFHNSDIDALNNSPRYPFITSMTCHTGRFAEPNQEAFGEHFILSADQGAIGFLGTSGWGYSYEDYNFLRQLFPIALQDTVRHLGEIVNRAKWRLWQDTPGSSHIQDLVLQYNLMGDPAVQLAIPDKPDLAMEAADINLIPEMPSESDSIGIISLKIRNYGSAFSDSVYIHVYAKLEKIGEIILENRLPIAPIKTVDSLQIKLPLKDMAGSVELYVQLDPDNLLKEYDESNNIAHRSFIILNNHLQASLPPNFELVPRNEVELGVEAIVKNLNNFQFIEFEIDTTMEYNSPLFQNSGKMTVDNFYVRWKPSLLLENQKYFWRCREMNDVSSTYSVSGYFHTGSENQWGWMQKDYFTDGLTDHVVQGSTVELDSMRDEINVMSGGLNDGNFAGIYFNRINYTSPGRGHHIVIINPQDGSIVDSRNFDLYGQTQSISDLVLYINQIPLGYWVLMAIQDEGSFNNNISLINAYKSVGSVACENIEFRDSWALIGIKGALPGSAREVLKKQREGEAAVQDTLIHLSKLGSYKSPRIGPSKSWKKMIYHAEMDDSSEIVLDLIGNNRINSNWDTLKQNLLPDKEIDLEGINSIQYPYLSMLAHFSLKNINSNPRLKSWQILFDPVPDLAVSQISYHQSADTVLSGQSIIISFDLVNIGLAKAESIKVVFYQTNDNGNEESFSTIKLPQELGIKNSINLQQTYIPDGRPGIRLLLIRIDPDNRIAELNESNNVLTGRVYVRPDTSSPRIKMLYDGREIAWGDLVASAPVIRALIYDDSPAAIVDTLGIDLFLDNERVSFSGSGPSLLLQPAAEAGARGAVEFRPQLSEGEHELYFRVRDASGNESEYSGQFRVISGLKLQRVMNYPNPFNRGTEFTFELTRAAEVQVRIYTVAGRMIRAIDGGWLGAGFNRIPWNGRDEEDDVLANGVYLYRVSADDGSHRAEVIEKAVVMR